MNTSYCVWLPHNISVERFDVCGCSITKCGEAKPVRTLSWCSTCSLYRWPIQISRVLFSHFLSSLCSLPVALTSLWLSAVIKFVSHSFPSSDAGTWDAVCACWTDVFTLLATVVRRGGSVAHPSVSAALGRCWRTFAGIWIPSLRGSLSDEHNFAGLEGEIICVIMLWIASQVSVSLVKFTSSSWQTNKRIKMLSMLAASLLLYKLSVTDARVG